MHKAWMQGGLLACLLLSGCGSETGPGSKGGDGENVGTARLQLTAEGGYGSLFKLGPATFTIEGNAYEGGELDPPLVIEADGEEEVLVVPMQAGYYSVRLEPDWVLSRSFDGSPFEAIDATVVGDNPISFSIGDLQNTDVTFSFAVGKSQLSLGIAVSEGSAPPPPGFVPEGYDGVVRPIPNDGRWELIWATGGGACCFDSVADAEASYPGYALYVRE